MLTFNLSTDLIPKQFRPDTYGQSATYSPDRALDNEMYHLRSRPDLISKFWDSFNSTAWKKNVATHYKEMVLPELQGEINDYLPSVVLSLTSPKLLSPRYYNYGTDWLLFDVEVNLSELVEYIDNEMNDEASIQWLHENYSSRDGFISMTPDSVDGLLATLSEQDTESDQACGVVLSHILKDFTSEGIHDSHQNYAGDVSDYISDPYLLEEINEVIENSIK